MKRILPATLIAAVLAIGSFGALAANAAMPTKTSAAIVADPPTPMTPEATEPVGTEPAEATDVPGSPDIGYADTNTNADTQQEGEN